MRARHAAVCPVCLQQIDVGSPIVFGSRWVHASCGDDPLDDEPRNPLCRSCHLHHAGDCT